MKNWRLHREELMTDEDWTKFSSQLNIKVLSKNWTDIQDRAICMIAVWTGLRRSELADLDIQDLHLDDNRPYIIVRHGKGDKYREVLVSEDCKAFILDFLILRKQRGGDALFSPQRGDRYTGDGLYRVWKTALADAGLEHKSMHKARHYNATKLYEVTKDLVFVKEQLGHARITTTQVYAHVLDHEASRHLSNFDNSLKR